MEATDRPLGDVLADLAPTLQTDLSATREIADQRVTLHIIDQPVYALMGRLIALLSHAPDRPHGYHWAPLDRPAGARPAFRFWRDLASEAEEQSARDYPRREAAVLLRDLRNMARMTPEARQKYPGDYPYSFAGVAADRPYAKALRGLSDVQLDALADGQPIPLDSALFAPEIAAWRQEQGDRQAALQKATLARGGPDPFPNGLPAPPDIPPTMTLSGADEDGLLPGLSSKYNLQLNGILDDSLQLDPYDTNKDRDPSRVKPPALGPDQGPVYDLTPLLTNKAVTPTQRGDVGFTLQQLAQAARISVYQEGFLRSSTLYGNRSDGLQTLKGPLPVLVAAICAEWDYRAQKVGDEYLFWSRTWAQDRATDVPERLIIPWRQRLQKQGGLTLDDRADIAAALTYPQIRLTLDSVLPEGTINSLLEYHALRTLGLLAPQEREAAFSSTGLVVATLPPWEQEEFIAGFRRKLSSVTDEQLKHAVLTFRVEQEGLPEPVVVMSLSADGQQLLGTRFVVPHTNSSPQSTAGASR